jgi:hypothetical protein
LGGFKNEPPKYTLLIINVKGGIDFADMPGIVGAPPLLDAVLEIVKGTS